MFFESCKVSSSPRSHTMAAPFLLVILASVLVTAVRAMPDGPVIPNACARLEPSHNESTPFSSDFPGAITISPTTAAYELGDTLDITISGGASATFLFRGFMIQAREAGQPLSTATYGTFAKIAADTKAQTLTCFRPNDTAAHANSDDASIVRVLWSATELPVSQIQFYVTVVQSFDQYWVRVASARINASIPEPEQRNYAILKSHGSLMVIAWTLFVPVGIMLALFYKVIWPNGEWFYSHIGIMCAAILLVIVGIAMAVWYAGGRWLTTTSLNNPHQVLGIISLVAIAVNPFLAIIRCDPASQWRFIYNWSHGLIGLFLAQGVAMAAMLLGLNIMRELPGLNSSFVHYAVYMVSASVGLIISIMAFYNLYTVNYNKNFNGTGEGSQIAPSTSEPPGSFPEYNYDDDELKETSRDYPLRAGLGITIIVLLLVFTVLAIIFIGLA